MRFEIDGVVPEHDELGVELEERFGLAQAHVADDVAGAAAALLPQLLTADDVLGVAWGETLAAISERLPPLDAAIPVVHLAAGFPKGEGRKQSLESGADGYLDGPVTPSELMALVQALLRAPRAEAE